MENGNDGINAVQLANGSQHSLSHVVTELKCLSTYDDAGANGQVILGALRRLSLAQSLSDEERNQLVGDEILAEDGSLSSVLRDVVLSAVRGEENRWRVESPFVRPIDRVKGEFLLARSHLRELLPHDEAEQFIRNDFDACVQDALNHVDPSNRTPDEWRKLISGIERTPNDFPSR